MCTVKVKCIKKEYSCLMFADGFHSMDEGCCLGDGLGDMTALGDREGSWGRHSRDEEGTHMSVCLIHAADLRSNISMTILNHTLNRFLFDEIAVAACWRGKVNWDSRRWGQSLMPCVDAH